MRIGLLMIDGFALMSYAAVIEPFRAANNLAGRALYDWTHLSVVGAEIVASNGLVSLADHAIAQAPTLDRIFVFAAGDPAAYADERCFGWLRQQARQEIVAGDRGETDGEAAGLAVRGAFRRQRRAFGQS